MAGPRRRKAVDLVRELRENRRCAVFYSAEELLKAATRVDIAAHVGRYAKAELLLRYSLRPEAGGDETWRSVRRMLTGWLGGPGLTDFCLACDAAEGRSPETAATKLDAALRGLREAGWFDARDEMAVREAVLPWLQADGVIPVFRTVGGAGYLLPFRFVDRMGEPAVRDNQSELVPEWSRHLAAMPEIEMDVQLDFPQSADEPFVGDSLMLPLRMAWWRRRRELPRYRPQRFLATGAFRGGRLGEVSTEEKARKVEEVAGGFLIRPGVSGRRGEIPVASTPDAVLERIRVWAEEESIGDAVYAMARLREFESLVRQTNATGWDSMIRRLERVGRDVDDVVDAEGWIRTRMLLSAAHCHAGRTEESARFNREVRAFIQGKANARYESQLLRLEIEDLVIQVDQESFDGIFTFAPDLESRLEDFARRRGEIPLVQDLRMRFYGTMGQAVAYAALAGRPQGSAEQARTYFDRAYRAAVMLKDQAVDAAEQGARLADMAQDANYRLLGAALFTPAEMDPLRAEAERICTALERDEYGEAGKKAAGKNADFRRRFHAFGLYRAWLAGSRPACIPDYGGLVHDGFCWIAATTGKYLGALHAAAGDVDRAKDYFVAADRKMSDALGAQDGGVLRIIHMTVCAEAYRSLRHVPALAAFADEMRRKALGFFALPDAASWRKEDWRAWLEHPDDGAGLPALGYWY